MTLDTLQRLLQRARDFPEAGLRLVDRAERETFHSWAAIEERSTYVAGTLAKLGIRPGERVGLIYPTSAEFFDAFFGTLLAGAVPVPLYPPVRLGRGPRGERRPGCSRVAARCPRAVRDRDPELHPRRGRRTPHARGR